MVDAANYMVDKGWRFQQAYRSSCHNKPIKNRIFHKDAASKEEAKKAF